MPSEIPLNQQPEWLNNQNGDSLMAPERLVNRNGDSFDPGAIPRTYAVRITEGVRTWGPMTATPNGDVYVAPSEGNIEGLTPPWPDSSGSTAGVYLQSGLSESIICERHRATIRETVTFTVDGTPETFCMKCLLEIIKERRISPRTSDSTLERNVQRFSRYDLLKGKNALSSGHIN